MSDDKPMAGLRAAISDGIKDLKLSGVDQQDVANVARVSKSTVTRWKKQEAEPEPDEMRRLAAKWPSFFDADYLSDLYAAAALRLDPRDFRTVGAQVLNGSLAVYRRVVEALNDIPPKDTDRVIRHVAFHLDRRDGTDPVETDPFLDDVVATSMREFSTTMLGRAAEGWVLRQVVAAGSEGRFDVVERRTRSIEGPNVHVRGYVALVPPVMSLLLIGQRDVFLAVDHMRFERPGSALLLRHRAVVEWATHHFEELFDAARFELRNPAGVVEEGLREMRAAIRSAEGLR